MKKISEWLETIEDNDTRERAIRNFKKQNIHDRTKSSLVDALEGAFTWSDTEEGFNYWDDVTVNYYKQEK